MPDPDLPRVVPAAMPLLPQELSDGERGRITGEITGKYRQLSGIGEAALPLHSPWMQIAVS